MHALLLVPEVSGYSGAATFRITFSGMNRFLRETDKKH